MESTSYFSAPSDALDPSLFQGTEIIPSVRLQLLEIVNTFTGSIYRNPEVWLTVWIAGSGASYQWSAARQPGDLDILVGVDYPLFRKANPEYAGLSDPDISADLNEHYRKDLQPQIAAWQSGSSSYEVTVFSNPHATDIRSIHPYAAYNLTHNEWTQRPDPQAHAPVNPYWDKAVASDSKMALTASVRFTEALADAEQAHDAPSRRNAVARLTAAIKQGVTLFDDIHNGRTAAFTGNGIGYADYANFRWQSAKRAGTIDFLRPIKKYASDQLEEINEQKYGSREFADANTLTRRAALYRAVH